MNSRRSTLRFGGLCLICVALLNLQAQQTRPAPGQIPPAAGTPTQQKPQLKFAIIGDTGTGTKPQYEVGQKLAATRATFPFEFVIMLGDNMYGGEGAKDFQTKFEKPYEALLSTGMKFYAALGNHDVPDKEIAYKPFNM